MCMWPCGKRLAFRVREPWFQILVNCNSSCSISDKSLNSSWPPVPHLQYGRISIPTSYVGFGKVPIYKMPYT